MFFLQQARLGKASNSFPLRCMTLRGKSRSLHMRVVPPLIISHSFFVCLVHYLFSNADLSYEQKAIALP
jgi:hypothetical protein